MASLAFSVPLVVLASGHSEEYRKAAYLAGAMDYVLQPFQPADLMQRCVAYVRSFRPNDRRHQAWAAQLPRHVAARGAGRSQQARERGRTCQPACVVCVRARACVTACVRAFVCLRACVCECDCVSVHACECACVCVCLCACVCVCVRASVRALLFAGGELICCRPGCGRAGGACAARHGGD
jgi:CheY-like chemotaxis protein